MNRLILFFTFGLTCLGSMSVSAEMNAYRSYLKGVDAESSATKPKDTSDMSGYSKTQQEKYNQELCEDEYSVQGDYVLIGDEYDYEKGVYWNRKSSSTAARWIYEDGSSNYCSRTYNTATECKKGDMKFRRGRFKLDLTRRYQNKFYSVKYYEKKNEKTTNYDWCVSNGYETS